MSQVSKFLSLVLRHDPGAIGITLDKNGWAEVEELLPALERAGKRITREELEAVVRESNKKRFTFDESGSRIRANQGHSISVDLELKPVKPPRYLYHGTTPRFLGSILRGGIRPQGRQHVHLSKERQTAVEVGRRHGKPTILTVEALEMHEAGHRFYCSANGVWLTEGVPSEFVSLDPKS